MPTRVLVLGASPSRGHALRRLTHLIAAAWEQHGAQVQVVTAPRPALRMPGHGPTGRALEGLALGAARLSRQVRTLGQDVDLVHVVDLLDADCASAVFGRTPVVVTCHDMSGLAEAAAADRAHPLRRLRARAALRGLERADTLLATSRFTADAVEEAVGRRPQVLHPPLDPALAERCAPNDPWSPPAWPYLMIVGGPEPHTRRDAAIHAWSHLRRTPHLDGASLVVVGPALTEPEEDLVTTCGGHVSVLTDVTDSHLAALYSRTRAVLALGRPRSFVWPIAEAHRAGKPVLATDHPLYQEVGAAGCVYLPVEGITRFDRATWASVAEDLSSPLVADRGGVNAERFAWHHFAEKLPAMVSGASRQAGDERRPAVAERIIPIENVIEKVVSSPLFTSPSDGYGMVLAGANPDGTRYLPPVLPELDSPAAVPAGR